MAASASTTLRVVITGSSADAIAAFQSAADAAEDSGARISLAGSKMAGDVGTAAEDAGSKLGTAIEGGTSRAGSALSKLASTASNWGIPFTGVLQDIGEKFDDCSTKGQTFMQAMSTLGGATMAAAGAGIAAVAVEGTHLAESFQQTEASIAANAGISQKAADAIGTAFLNTAGSTKFSGQEIASAYAGVAAQLGATEGKALSTQQAMQVMSAAMDLAEATGQSLSSTTKSLATVMQVYGLNTKDAASASDEIFNASRMAGVQVSSFTSSLQRVHTQLGSLTPSLTDTGALMVDLADHGESGRRAVSALSTAMNTLVKPAESVIQAQQNLKTVTKDLPPQLQSLAQAYINGSITSEQLTTTTEGLTSTQAKAWSDFKSAADAIDTDKVKLQELGVTVMNSNGQFVGLQSIIGQLHDKIQGMTQAQALATLTQAVGTTGARQLLGVVEAGPAAYQKDIDAVQKQGSAHAAAQKQAATLKDELETLGSAMEDEATKIGLVLIPIITSLAKTVSDVINWFMQHKAAAEALAAVIGTVLTAAMAVYTEQKLANFISKTSSAVGDVGNFASALSKLPSKLPSMSSIISDVQSFGSFLAQIPAKLAALVGAQSAAGASADAMSAQTDVAAASLTAADTAGTPWIAIGAAIVAACVAIGAAMYELATHFETVVHFVEQYWQFLLAPFTMGATLIVKYWHQIWDVIGPICEPVINAVEGAVQVMGSTLSSVFSSIVGGIETAASGIYSGIMGVVHWFEAIPGEIYNFLKAIPTDLWNLAKSAMHELAEGLVTFASDTIGHIPLIGSKIVSAMKSALGIHSPSTVMANEVGDPIMQGIAQGIKNGQTLVDEVEKSVDLVSKLQAQMNQLRQMMQKIWGDIGTDTKREAQSLNDVVKIIDFVTKPTTSLSTLETKLKSGWQAIDNDIKSAITFLNQLTHLLDFSTAPSQSLDKLRNYMKQVWAAIGTDTSNAKNVENELVKAIDLFSKPANDLKQLQSYLKSMWGTIGNDTKTSIAGLNALVKILDFVSAPSTSMKKLESTLKSDWSTIVNDAKSGLSNLKTQIKSEMDNAATQANTSVQTLVSDFNTGFSKLRVDADTPLKGLISDFTSTFNSIEGTVQSGWTTVISYTNSSMLSLQSLIQSTLNMVYNFFQTVLQEISSFSQSQFSSLSATVVKIMVNLQGQITATLTTIYGLFTTFFADVQGVTTGFEGQWMNDWATISSTLAMDVGSIASQLVVLESDEQTLETQTNTYLTQIEAKWNQLTTNINSDVGTMKSAMSQLVQAAQQAAQAASQVGSSQGTATGNANAGSMVADLISDLGLPNTSTTQGMLTAWMNAEGAPGNTGYNNPFNTKGGVGGSYGGVTGTAGITDFPSTQQGAAYTAQLISSAYGGILAALKAQSPSQFLSAVTSSPWGTTYADLAGALGAVGLQIGGVVTGPTLAMVGEQSLPEAVIPLSNPARAAQILRGLLPSTTSTVQPLPTGTAAPAGQSGSTGSNVNQSVQVNVAQEADANRIASEVGWLLKTMG